MPTTLKSVVPGDAAIVETRGSEYVCDSSSFLLSSIDVPAQSQIVEASEKRQLLVMFLRLDMPTVRNILSRDDLLEVKGSSNQQGLAGWHGGYLTSRLVQLAKPLLGGWFNAVRDSVRRWAAARSHATGKGELRCHRGWLQADCA